MNADTVSEDMKRLVEEMGEAFEWTNEGGVTKEYQGIFSPRTDTKDYGEGGYDAGFDWTCYCRLADFDIGTPLIGDTFKKAGRFYRVVEIVFDPYKAAAQFTLTDEDN